MGRFRADEVDNYGGNGGTGFFSLRNDKDVARVRIMYNSAEDVTGYAVHEVKINDKKRYVNCLREYNEPLSKCPFCEARMYQTAKLFIPLYNIDEDRVQIWERGKKFFGKLSSVCARYASKEPLVSHVFEIERNGKPKETSTTYEIYDIEKDGTTLEDLPEIPDPIGSVILDKSADDMNYYLESGEFPPEDDSAHVRRRSRREEKDEVPFEENRRGSGRRTPAGRREAF